MSNTSSSNNSDPSQNKMASSEDVEKLAESFKQKIPQYISQIVDVWQTLSYVEWKPKVASSLQYFCHRLAGSSATYGFDEISDCVRDIEKQLITAQEYPDHLTPELFDAIKKDIEQLKNTPIVQTKKVEIPEIKSQNANLSEGKPIFIVDDDEDTAQYLKQLLDSNGFKSRYFLSIAESIKAAPTGHPSVVIMDINFPEGRLAGIEAISEIRQAVGYRLPVIMHSARKDFRVRMEASNNGCDGFLSKPINPDELKVALEKVLGSSEFQDSRVLIIDDDTSIALYYRAVLNKMGIDSKHVAEPMKSLQVISDYQPHLILLDNMMPDCTGVELAKILKQDPKMLSTGIVFITADNDFTLSDKILALGVNGYLQKPVSVEQLQNTVRQFLVSSRQFGNKIEKIVHKSPQHQVSTQNFFFSEAEHQLLTESDKYHGLLMIAFESFDSVRKSIGMAKGTLLVEKLGAAVARNLNNNTLATKLGDCNYLVLLRDEGLNPLIEASNRIVDDINAFYEKHQADFGGSGLRFSLAPTANSEDTIESLISRCESQLEEATEHKMKVCDQSLIKDAKVDVSALDQSLIEKSLKAKQFALVYQPIFALDTNVEGKYLFDSFIRLKADDGREFYPEQFFPFIKDKVAYSSLDRFVIESVIEQLEKLNKSMNKEVFIQARLTEQALVNRDTLLWLSNSMRNRRILNPETLVFELSEACLLRNRESADYFTEKVKVLGCQMAITDYGESTQSIELLKELEPQFVKFKASLIEDKQNGVAKRAVEYLVQHAQKHGTQVVACKVENAMLISQLYSLGVQFYQGYFINHPTSDINLEIEQSLTM